MTTRPDWAPAHSQRFVITATAASTDPIEGRDMRLSRRVLERLVGRAAGMPMHRNHSDVRVGTVLTAALKERQDGGAEVVVETEAWVPEGADPVEYLGSGLSIAGMEGLSRAPIIVGADSMTFDEGALDEIRSLVLDAGVQDLVGVDRYHQFAQLPPPVIVIQLSDPAVLHILYGTAATALYDLLKTCVHRLQLRTKQPEEKTRLRITVGEMAEVDFLLPLAGDDLLSAIDAAFDGVVRIINATRSPTGDADEP